MNHSVRSARIPVLTFDSRSAPADRQFELFHDTTAPVFDTLPIGDPARFAARTTDYLVDDVVVSGMAHSPQRLRRSLRHVRSGAGGALAVLLPRRGRLHVRIDDADLVLDAHHVAVIDLARPFHAVCADVDALWVLIPRRSLPCGAPPAGAARFHRNSPHGRVLTRSVLSMWDRLPSARRSDAPSLCREVVGAVESVLPADDLAASDDGLPTAMRDFILANLDDLELDAATLMHRFCCSRSTLYRVFGRYGGVAAYIRDQRLERCLDDLIAPVGTIPLVGQVAGRWGFENPSHFHRLFTARYGVPPSVVRQGAIRATRTHYEPSTKEKITTFHQWATR